MLSLISDTERKLIKAIGQAPKETARQLDYAAWLTDNGQPEMAEFIVALVEMQDGFEQRNETDPGTVKYRTLTKHIDAAFVKQSDLLEAYKELWIEGFHLPPGTHVRWDNSFTVFPQCVTFDNADAFLEYSEVLAERFPGAGFLLPESNIRETLVPMLNALPASITKIHLEAHDDTVITLLCNHPTLLQVQALSIPGNPRLGTGHQITDESIARLRDSPYTANIHHLNILGNRITADAIATILQPPTDSYLRPETLQRDLWQDRAGALHSNTGRRNPAGHGGR